MTETTFFLELRRRLGEAIRRKLKLERELYEFTGGGCPYLYASKHGLHAEPTFPDNTTCHRKTDEERRNCPLAAEGKTFSCWSHQNVIITLGD